MKGIKYRAWDKVSGIMRDVLGISFYHESISVDRGDGTYFANHASNFELMQYTGLKDKNGTEIYEGDIVENASKDLKFQVVYEAPSFNRKWIDNTSKRYREHLTEPLAWNTYMICEVIGNIYENSELLEADSDE